MILIERHNWDIGTTAIKGQLTGSVIQLSDNVWKTVSDWYIDFATGMINIIFEEDNSGDPASMFKLSDKFKVKIPDSIFPIKHKKFRTHK